NFKSTNNVLCVAPLESDPLHSGDGITPIDDGCNQLTPLSVLQCRLLTSHINGCYYIKVLMRNHKSSSNYSSLKTLEEYHKNAVVTRLLRFWEARNVKKGRELTSSSMRSLRWSKGQLVLID
ncbi:unnamed protein product, partial [Brassica oleracea]